MSWDAYLTDDAAHDVGCWNYSHNCNAMIAVALHDVLGCVNALEVGSGPLDKAIGPAWWDRLDGCPGPVGASFLHALIGALESDPERFREMNPSNGWGDYDGLVKVLTEMRNAVPEWPTTWSASG